ncbi:DEAD/DEAH box helicase [Novosphingobium sp. ST904]|uniref:DEAD/DEAH box helicase n=2 Tax=Novosphingobium sp. ST904 TaxID=1684385 RepID=UPI001051C81D|nr:DEAD/DEAH box helicase [Novosphingobium sp. ST904]TCM23811.1 helicase-like protein [Novosphingobium sp. ST904]
MIPELSDDILYFAIQSDRMVEAGKRYFQQGRVSDLRIDQQFDTVSALVRGSGKNHYVTSIIFDEDEEFGGLPASECTCPVGMGCKHVAAVLFALQASGVTGQQERDKPRLRIQAQSGSVPTVAGPLAEWLEAVVVDDLAMRAKYEELCFSLEPVRTFKQGKRPGKGMPAPVLPERYSLQVRAWRRWPHEITWRPAHPWEVQHGRGSLRPEAGRLLSRMTHAAGGDFTANRSPTGRNGWSWLWEASVEGLLRWKAPDGPAATVRREHFVCKLRWETLSDARQIVGLDMNGHEPAEHMIFVGDPPIHFDVGTREFRLIDAGEPLLAGRLLAMPPIASHEIPALAVRWKAIAHDMLPAPELASSSSLTGIAPQPVLRCLVDKVGRPYYDRGWRGRSASQGLEVARLEFDYGGHRVGPLHTATEVIASGSEGVIRIARDIEAEQAAVDRLARTSLVPLALSGRYETKPLQGWDHAFVDEDHEHDQRFCEFLVNDAQALRDEGWLIEFAPKWPHVLLQPEDGGLQAPGIEVSQAPSSGANGKAIDWFDVELAARVEGDQRIDVLPALRRLLASGVDQILERDDEYRIPLPLGGGRFTALRLGSVRPLIETIVRMALVDRSAATLKLSKFDLGAVHDLANAGLPWASKDRLRALAARLNSPGDETFVAPAGLDAQLRAYQATGCGWLAALREAGMGGILADDMGLGKTLQAITHILAIRGSTSTPRPVLIVAPTSVLPNWQAEIARFAPGLACLLWHGADRRHAHGDDFTGADIVLTSYTLLARDSGLFASRDFTLVILDEAHGLKNPKTAGFKAAAVLKADQVVALTGTPVENRLTDLWSLASLTNPGLLGTYEGFRTSYRTPIEKHGDPTARTALARRIRPFMLRRTKDAVAADLPPKTIIPERIDLAPPQLRLYESQRLLMHKRVRDEIDRVGLMRSQIIVLDAMLKLRQICCDPVLLPNDLGAEVASAKRERLREMVPELIAESRRIIIFSQFTTMLDLIAGDLERIGIPFEQLRGATRDRGRPVRRFQEGGVPIILVSLKAGGAGVNLTAADTVILYDPWWNPAVEAQAIDRAHRIGQSKPVFVHRLIATGTIEEKILALQERKRGLADMLWDEEAKAGSTSLTDADIDFLLG